MPPRAPTVHRQVRLPGESCGAANGRLRSPRSEDRSALEHCYAFTPRQEAPYEPPRLPNDEAHAKRDPVFRWSSTCAAARDPELRRELRGAARARPRARLEGPAGGLGDAGGRGDTGGHGDAASEHLAEPGAVWAHGSARTGSSMFSSRCAPAGQSHPSLGELPGPLAERTDYGLPTLAPLCFRHSAAL